MISLRRMLLLCAALAAPACGSSPPATKHYRLAVPTAATQLAVSRSTPKPTPQQPAPALMVEEFQVDTAYDDPRIVYRTGPYTLEHYHYHRWSSSPGRLVSETLRQAYDRTGLFERVEPAWTSGVPLLLQGRILAIEEVDVTEQRWLAHLELQLRLVDAETEEVLWTHHIEEVEPLGERSPEGLARAMSAALGRVVAKTAPRIAIVAAGVTEASSDRVAAGTAPR